MPINSVSFSGDKKIYGQKQAKNEKTYTSKYTESSDAYEGKKKLSAGKKVAIGTGIVSAAVAVGATVWAYRTGKNIAGKEAKLGTILKEGFKTIGNAIKMAFNAKPSKELLDVVEKTENLKNAKMGQNIDKLQKEQKEAINILNASLIDSPADALTVMHKSRIDALASSFLSV